MNKRGAYNHFEIVWCAAECYALAYIVAQDTNDAAALERTDDHLTRAADQIAMITGQEAAEVRARLVADAHEVVAVSTPMVVRAGDVITDPVTPFKVPTAPEANGANLAPKPRRRRGPGRKAAARRVQVGDIVVQAFSEQVVGFRVTEISEDGAQVTGVQVNGSTPGRKWREHTNRVERVELSDLYDRIDIPVEADGHRGRIAQAIVTRHRGKFRVVCSCLDGLEVCTRSRAIHWSDTVEDAQIVWRDHLAAAA